MIPKVIEAEYVHDYIIHLRFADGIEGDVNLSQELYGEMFEPLKDPEIFARFAVHPEFHTLCWPKGEFPMNESIDDASLEDAINATYPGLMLFARDVDLAPALAEKYTDGLVVQERGFTDATPRLGGMVTSHRYVILSNHMADFDSMLGDDRDPNAPNWRLHVAGRDSRFKVLRQKTVEGRTLIFVLHLPNDERWRLFTNLVLNIDEDVLAKAVSRMEVHLREDPIPEVTSADWLDRCKFPLGMSDDGELFPLT